MLKSYTIRILLSVLAASLLSIAFTVFWGMRAMEEVQEHDVRDRMISEASLAGEVFRLNGGSGAGVHAWFEDGRYQNMRVTVIDPDGRVAYESSPELGAGLDNHSDRPEVREALRDGSGFIMRESGSLGTAYVYAASRLADGTILRLGAPLDQVRHVMWSRTEMLLQTGIVAAFLSLLFAVLVSYSLKKSFLPMIRVVEDIAAGHLRRRIRKYPGCEFAPLAEAVNTMAQSIEEQVRAQADQTAQLETILNTMSDGVLVLGQKGHIRRCNRAMERWFPSLGDARGRQVVEIIPSPVLQNAVQEMLKDCDASRPGVGGPQTVSMHVGLHNGRVFSVLLTRPQRPEPRLGLVAVFHDITDLMRLERVRTDFVANVSHELRTPLTAISGYAETLMSEDNVEQCHRFADVILRNARGLETMTRDLLELARLERSDSVVELEPVQPLACAEAAARICAEAFEKRSVSVDLDIPEACLVMAEESLLSQVFRNLLENAARYAETGSSVSVSSRYSEGQVFLRVHNAGPLIPRQELERIFERFYSVERHRGQGSTGLGLAICRHIMERLHGRIWAESPDTEGGTSFVFTVARAADADCGPECDADEAEPDA